jgi:hypothetical protein
MELFASWYRAHPARYHFDISNREQRGVDSLETLQLALDFAGHPPPVVPPQGLVFDARLLLTPGRLCARMHRRRDERILGAVEPTLPRTKGEHTGHRYAPRELARVRPACSTGRPHRTPPCQSAPRQTRPNRTAPAAPCSACCAAYPRNTRPATPRRAPPVCDHTRPRRTSPSRPIPRLPCWAGPSPAGPSPAGPSPTPPHLPCQPGPTAPCRALPDRATPRHTCRTGHTRLR